jgi:hypothetical protein
MDASDPPTAADLGISDGQYEQIMLDLQRRERSGPGTVAQRRAALASQQGTPTSRVLLVVLGAILGMVVLSRLVAVGSSEPDPVYAFMVMNGDRPVTYSSCRPIQVAVYPSGGPPDAEALVREAVTQMRAATGLDITVIGSFGGHAPNWNFQTSSVTAEDPISVSWQDQDALARMTDDVAGLGGSPYVPTSGGGQRFIAGSIALSHAHYMEWAEQGWHAEELAVLLHEFGHVFGLDHVHSRHELMNEDNVGLTHFGPGDLEGLRLLGQGPCV